MYQKTVEDPTLYKVVAQTRSYCARISYQDNKMIWFKAGDKPVKILKENIASTFYRVGNNS